jgi:hypothetical protein
MGKNTRGPGKPPEPKLPTNEEAERFLLGSVLFKEQKFDQLASLRKTDFDSQRHQHIFERMTDLHRRGERIDPTTAFLELQRHEETEHDTLSYLIELDHGLPDVPDIGRYVRDVREASVRRRLVHAAQELRFSAADPLQNLPALLLLQRKYLEDIEQRCEPADDIIDNAPSPWAYRHLKTNYLVEDLLLQGGVTVWSALSGDGKSTLALAMSAAVAVGKPFLGRATIQSPVIYVDKENPVSLVNDRLDRLGIEQSIGTVMKVLGGWREGHEPPGPDNTALIAYARRKKPLIIFDSLIAFANCDENSSTEMRRHMHLYRTLATIGASVLVQHHRSEKSVSPYRGSTDIIGVVDSLWLLSRDDGTTAADPLGRLLLKPVKTRAGPRKPIRIEYVDGVFLPVDGPARPPLDIICELVLAYPGSMQREMIDAARRYGMTKNLVLTTLDTAVLQRLIEQKPGRSGRQKVIRYYPLGSSLEGVQ